MPHIVFTIESESVNHMIAIEKYKSFPNKYLWLPSKDKNSLSPDCNIDFNNYKLSILLLVHIKARVEQDPHLYLQDLVQ